MKVTFEGSPENVLTEMKQWIESMEPTTLTGRPIAIEDVQRARAEMLGPVPKDPPIPLSPSIASIGLPIATNIDLPAKSAGETTEVPSLGNRPSGSDIACRFCVRYEGSIKRVARHEIHCHKNPQRIPHPREGQGLNPGLAAYHAAQKLKSAGTKSASSESIGIPETKSTEGMSLSAQ